MVCICWQDWEGFEEHQHGRQVQQSSSGWSYSCWRDWGSGRRRHQHWYPWSAQTQTVVWQTDHHVSRVDWWVIILVWMMRDSILIQFQWLPCASMDWVSILENKICSRELVWWLELRCWPTSSSCSPSTSLDDDPSSPCVRSWQVSPVFAPDLFLNITSGSGWRWLSWARWAQVLLLLLFLSTQEWEFYTFRFPDNFFLSIKYSSIRNNFDLFKSWWFCKNVKFLLLAELFHTPVRNSALGKYKWSLADELIN